MPLMLRIGTAINIHGADRLIETKKALIAQGFLMKDNF